MPTTEGSKAACQTCVAESSAFLEWHRKNVSISAPFRGSLDAWLTSFLGEKASLKDLFGGTVIFSWGSEVSARFLGEQRSCEAHEPPFKALAIR